MTFQFQTRNGTLASLTPTVRCHSSPMHLSFPLTVFPASGIRDSFEHLKHICSRIKDIAAVSTSSLGCCSHSAPLASCKAQSCRHTQDYNSYCHSMRIVSLTSIKLYLEAALPMQTVEILPRPPQVTTQHEQCSINREFSRIAMSRNLEIKKEAKQLSVSIDYMLSSSMQSMFGGVQVSSETAEEDLKVYQLNLHSWILNNILCKYYHFSMCLPVANVPKFWLSTTTWGVFPQSVIQNYCTSNTQIRQCFCFSVHFKVPCFLLKIVQHSEQYLKYYGQLLN